MEKETVVLPDTEIVETKQDKYFGYDFDKMTPTQIHFAIYEIARQRFLSKYTIPMIQSELKQYVIGQDELIKQVSVFIYYHMLRQNQPDLSIRPLLISGPSGSGKTEIWRVAKKLYSDYLHIEIVDGSSITQDGWSGQRKISSILQALDMASILVIDEFDKLAAPSFSKSGDNVSHHLQSELLKLLEGEYTTAGFRKDSDTADITYDTNTLGIVLVGAFESIREEKESNNTIGFMQHKAENASKTIIITDEDLIDFGVMPEIVGRISDKCTTNKLSADQYLTIIKNQYSKVGKLIKKLNELGIDDAHLMDDEQILELARQSQVNMLGARWLSAQIESKLLESLINADLRSKFVNHNEKQDKEKQESSQSAELF